MPEWQPRPAAHRTFDEWLDHWLTNIASRRVRPRTLESYEGILRLHLKPGLGHPRMDRLQPEHLAAFYSRLSEKGLSAASILRVHRVLSRALKVAMQRGKTSRNVATLVDAPTVRRPETALPLDVDEARRLLHSAESTRNAARWTVALALGLHQSEALALRWMDVDLLRGTLSVQRGIHPDLSTEPGPATERSGTYPDGTHTRWPDPACRTPHGRTLSGHPHGPKVTARVESRYLARQLRR